VERRLLASQLSRGNVVVDAGANIGVYSRFLSKCVGPTGFVHSFEPSPENFARLQAGVAAYANVYANQMAVGDRTGDALLYVSDELNVDHRSYATEKDQRRSVPMRMIALDDYLKPGERVDLLKLDIQGSELHALRGALRILTENPSIKLLLEFWPYGLRSAGVSARELVTFLKQHGFALYRIDSGGLVSYEELKDDTDPPPSVYYNLFARRDAL
jgi:FkbM family methyltransferase